MKIRKKVCGKILTTIRKYGKIDNCNPLSQGNKKLVKNITTFI